MIRAGIFKRIKFSEYKRAKELLQMYNKGLFEDNLKFVAMRNILENLHYSDKVYHRLRDLVLYGSKKIGGSFIFKSFRYKKV